MNPDLYAAWLTAGNNLQPAAAWIARNWTNLAIAAVLALAACLIWHALRRADQQIATIHTDFGNQPEPRTEERP